ncbi:MAG TPA: hypothetical protein VG326_08410 [Tepidisphaeraceae bacterium]|jgi:hypothetical protein|nr:hypothetical protein [Tepidisphaeraceae bacterium]
MFRRIHQSLLFLVLLSAGGGGVFLYREHNSTEHKLQEKLEAANLRTEELKQVVTHLENKRRVADVMVTEQNQSAGIFRTTLLFVEYARDGITQLNAGKYFTIEGKRAHIDAMVIKFDGKFVESNDPLRGHSLALFTRLYGENQDPAHAFPIDEPEHIPAIYQGTHTVVEPFERDLWKNFWKLADDPEYRNSMGVRIAQGEGVWRDFDKGWIYRLTLQSNGGLDIAPERIKGILQEALDAGRRAGGAGSSSTTSPTRP